MNYNEAVEEFFNYLRYAKSQKERTVTMNEIFSLRRANVINAEEANLRIKQLLTETQINFDKDKFEEAVRKILDVMEISVDI